MRIALVDPSLFTLPYDTALATGLVAAGHEVQFHGRKLRPQDGPGAPALPILPSFYRLAETRTAARLPKRLHLLVKGADHALSMLRLAGLLRRARPDIIHFQWLPLPAIDSPLLAMFRSIAPVVLTVHDTEAFNGSPTARLQGIGFTRALAACDRLIVHTRQGRQRLLGKGIPPERITVLPHGPLLQVVPAPAPDPMQGTLTFVLFGKIKPYKGTDTLIEAFAALPPALRAQARLHIIGQSYIDLAPLHARIAQLGVGDRVDLHARFVAEHDIPAIFGAGTIATFPYREIEASGVLSLAIAFGRPILASRLGAFAEQLEDGVHGCLVAPADRGALAAALARFIEDRAFGARAALHVRDLSGESADWHAIAHRTGAVYAEALSGL
jgi:glycosyltransferase involved in cell wall biosynthesis